MKTLEDLRNGLGKLGLEEISSDSGRDLQEWNCRRTEGHVPCRASPIAQNLDAGNTRNFELQRALHEVSENKS